ncbi:unnamed protein product [Coregonus sp. 'balchen']|nr:unnamed protein product [Coregonus sp. 'balchen']
MGRIFLDHIGGTRLFSCANCGEPAVQRGAGPCDADGQTHGARRQLQELQQQAGLDLRVCHRRQSALQGRPRHPRKGASKGERGL